MSYPRAAWVAAVTSLVLAACGSGGAAGQRAAFRSAFAGQRASVNRIAVELRATLDQAGPDPDALLADSFSALGARAAQKAERSRSSPTRRLTTPGYAIWAQRSWPWPTGSVTCQRRPPSTSLRPRAPRCGRCAPDAADVMQAEAWLAQDLGLAAG
jgi:hypothetical protein